MKRKNNIPCEEGSWNIGTEMRKDRLNLLDSVKTMHDVFFFEDIVIIQNLKGWHCKVVVHIFFSPKGILILEHHKAI